MVMSNFAFRKNFAHLQSCPVSTEDFCENSFKEEADPGVTDRPVVAAAKAGSLPHSYCQCAGWAERTDKASC